MKKRIYTYCLAVLITTVSLHTKAQGLYYYGDFKIKKIVSYYDSLNKPVNFFATSFLYPDSVYEHTIFTDNFGTVFYNDTSLMYDYNLKLYHDTVQRYSNERIKWNFESHDTEVMSSFSITTSNEEFPTIANVHLLPNDLRKSQDFVLEFGSVSYADEIEILFMDGQFRMEFPFNRRISADTTSVNIPSSDFETLDGEAVTIMFSLIKNEYQIIDGKRFKFEKRFDIVRHVPLLN